MSLFCMRHSHRFIILPAILFLGFATFGAWSLKVFNRFQAPSLVYQHIVEDKDLNSDMSPPAGYIIKSYLVSVHVLSAPVAERKILIANLKSLKNDYDINNTFWRQENRDDALKNQLLIAADKPAQEFYRIAFSQFIPALEKGDNAVSNMAFEKMRESYSEYRAEISTLAEVAIKRSEVDEAKGKTGFQTVAWMGLNISIGMTALIGLFLQVNSLSLSASLKTHRKEIRRNNIDTIATQTKYRETSIR